METWSCYGNMLGGGAVRESPMAYPVRFAASPLSRFTSFLGRACQCSVGEISKVLCTAYFSVIAWVI